MQPSAEPSPIAKKRRRKRKKNEDKKPLSYSQRIALRYQKQAKKHSIKHEKVKDRALTKREKTLEMMFRYETKKVLDLFDSDGSGTTDFEEFRNVVENILVPDELPLEFQDNPQAAIESLDTDGSGELELDEVNVWFKEIFKNRVQSRGFKRVRELKQMRDAFEVAQATVNTQDYLLLSHADQQLLTFFRCHQLEADLYNNPIIELSDRADRETNPEIISRKIEELASESLEVAREKKIWFEDLSRWYVRKNGGWKSLRFDEGL